MEPFPDMTTSEKWFLIKFVPGRKGRESCMCYSTHANMYKRIFKKFGISTWAATHINRAGGRKDLEAADVDDSQAQKHGGWGLECSEAV